MSISGIPDSPASHSDSIRDPYRGVVIVLLALAALGTLSALAGGVALANPVLLDAAVTLGLSTGVLLGVALIQTARARPQRIAHGAPSPVPSGAVRGRAHAIQTPRRWMTQAVTCSRGGDRSRRRHRFARAAAVAAVRCRSGSGTGSGMSGRWERSGCARDGRRCHVAIALLLLLTPLPIPLDPLTAGIAAALCLGAAGMAAAAVRYLANLEPARLPEGPGLLPRARGWSAGSSCWPRHRWAWNGRGRRRRSGSCTWSSWQSTWGCVMASSRSSHPRMRVSRRSRWTSVCCGRSGTGTNVLASVLDAAERQLGIDLRSTWALTVVRRSIEPLVIGLALRGLALDGSLTMVGVEEQGLVERLGVPVGGRPLLPGIHVHWPWPIDQVFRIPVLRVQALTVGHEGQEETGPENVLWAQQHAANEYTLLLGNGRDLITVDAAVQFRIADARAWRYHSQNPGDALRAIAYRAVMRSTVNRTLNDALSENVVTTTAHMREMVQQDADALDLGVEVLGFTVGGMHPPVPVASAYQAVVSAELGKVTAVVNAQAVRNRTVPLAESSVLVNENTARAEGAEALAKAAGEAWSFRTLESQYRAEPQDYFFRRRLETLEKGLAGRVYTVVDSRFQRDGGELWVTP